MLITNSEKDFAMNQPKFVVVLLLLFIFSGCSPTLATPGNQPGSKETATQASPLPTETRASVSLTPTDSLQSVAGADFVNNSIDLTLVAFESVTVDGFLVLMNLRTDDYFFYDMKNQKTMDISQNHEKVNV
jgi:hypothetical protein